MKKLTFEEFFEELPDPRIDRRKRHSLLDILFVSVCAVICGATSFVDMADFGNAKEGWLRERLELENGIPSHDTFRRLFILLEPDAFLQCFVKWASHLAEVISRPDGRAGDVVALDGKTLRRSFSEATGLGAVHVLNAFSSVSGLCLGQLKVGEKSNEITAVPALLEMLDVAGSVVTADALNTQKEIAAKVIAKGGDYCLALKGNHPTLHKEVKLYFESGLREGFEENVFCCEGQDYGHGRSELRQTWLVSTKELPWLETKGWTGLRSIVASKSTRSLKNRESVEIRYFLTSLTDVKKAASSIRSHWQVENNLHWVLDVDFREDDCTARTGHAAENFALLRKIALNMLKKESTKKTSIRRKVNKACWDNDFLARIVCGV